MTLSKKNVPPERSLVLLYKIIYKERDKTEIKKKKYLGNRRSVI